MIAGISTARFVLKMSDEKMEELEPATTGATDTVLHDANPEVKKKF